MRREDKEAANIPRLFLFQGFRDRIRIDSTGGRIRREVRSDVGFDKNRNCLNVEGFGRVRVRASLLWGGSDGLWWVGE